MRDPSIHIKLSDLANIIDRMGFEDAQHLAFRIAQMAVPFSIKDRYIIKTDSVGRKKATRHIQAGKDVAGITISRLNAILTECRLKAGHRNIMPIRQNDPQYLQLKELAVGVIDFCEAQKFTDIEEGARVFFTFGLGFMKHSSKYGLNKFTYYRQKIYNRYESYVTVAEDPKQDATRELYEIYQERLYKTSSIRRELKDSEEYANMVYARLEADAHQARYSDWVEAQFQEMVFMKAVPNPEQLFGEGAEKRYYSFMQRTAKKKNLISVEEVDYRGDFARRYKDSLRDKNSTE